MMHEKVYTNSTSELCNNIIAQYTYKIKISTLSINLNLTDIIVLCTSKNLVTLIYFDKLT